MNNFLDQLVARSMSRMDAQPQQEYNPMADPAILQALAAAGQAQAAQAAQQQAAWQQMVNQANANQPPMLPLNQAISPKAK